MASTTRDRKAESEGTIISPRFTARFRKQKEGLMAEQDKDKVEPEQRRRNLSGGIGWDGDTPVFVIGQDEDGSALIGRFASVEVSAASLTPDPPEHNNE